MTIRFHKMQGAGNDFVVLDLRQQHINLDPQKCQFIADRKRGIGCDQIMVLLEPDQPEQIARYEIWNSDGSRAGQCGNGVRCIGLYLKRNSEVSDETFTVGSPAGNIELQCLEDNQVCVNMGKPEFTPAIIPFSVKRQENWYSLPVNEQEIEIGAVSMGNPHAVTLVDDIDTAPVASLGPQISYHDQFLEGCNAGFAQYLNASHIRLRVHERGVGETLACGTGACAAMAVLRQNGLVEERVTVTLPGGALIIEWQGQASPLYMSGPASHVFEGILE